MNAVKKTREEEALDEIAGTRISKGTAWFLVGAFAAVLLGVPLWDEWLAFRKESSDPEGAAPASRPDLGVLVPDWEALRGAQSLGEGVAALPTARELQAFEDDLEDASFLRRALLTPVQTWLYRVGAGNEQVYPGREGWLFYRSDVDHVTGPGFLDPDVLERRRRGGDEVTAAPEPDPLNGIGDLHAQLAARGIELLVVPVPVKPSVHPEFLTPRFEERAGILRNPSYEAFQSGLSEAGIRSVDLGAEFERRGAGEEALYLATDTHWTPKGARLAAEAIASEVRALVRAESSDEPRFVRRDEELANLGDIARMLQLTEPAALFDEEVVAIQRVQEVRAREASEGARVLVLGDSFANIYSLEGMGWGSDAGLVEQLQVELQEPVDGIVINDNGSFATRRELSRELQSGRDRLAGVRVVVYEFAARELSFGDWKRFDLTVGSRTGGDSFLSASSVAPRKVTGTLRAFGQVPRSGTVPYREAITSWHLTDVRAEGAEVESELVVFRWGMRDGAWTAAARPNLNESVRLDIVPWSTVSTQFGGYNRAELADEALWSLPTYWAVTDDADVPARAVASEPSSPEPASPGGSWSPSHPDVQKFVAALRGEAGREVVEGVDDWLFFGPELRHLTAGPFWGESAVNAARASKPEWRDPLPAILDFKSQLDTAGIELWLVPVPPKAALYPTSLGVPAPPSGVRVDPSFAQFAQVLRDEGVQVLDLVPFLREHISAEERSLYCRQDTHWSPYACELVAERLAELLQDRPWRTEQATRDYSQAEGTLTVEGDLWKALGRSDLPREVLTLNRVSETRDEQSVPVEPWRESPVLLLGDSHTLVFHEGGDLLATGAGLSDRLALELGFPVDVLGVRGSGSTASRLSLLRRRDNLAGKRVVLWVFAAREFTESLDGWRKVPVIR